MPVDEEGLVKAEGPDLDFELRPIFNTEDGRPGYLVTVTKGDQHIEAVADLIGLDELTEGFIAARKQLGEMTEHWRNQQDQPGNP
jgi:hypothetical protein